MGWEKFTDRIIEILNEREKPIAFILWGAPARKKKKMITNPKHFIVESAHQVHYLHLMDFSAVDHFLR